MPYKDLDKRREAARQYSAIWRERHPEKAKQLQREFYYRNKEVRRAEHREWLARHPKYPRQWYLANKNKMVAYARDWAARNKKKIAIAARKARLKHPEKRRAVNAVNGALRSGQMIRPSHCSLCGKKGKLHGHHFLGYEKEHWLSVLWLCVPCHEAAHH